MNDRLTHGALALVLVLAFGGVGTIFGQTSDATVPAADDLTDVIASVDAAANIDTTALLTKLSAQFRVELSVLQDLNTQGYTAGQIWLALEMCRHSGVQLSEAVVQVASLNTEGHGWGTLAQALGIDPGSAQFFELKEQMRTHSRTMASEVAAEHGNRSMTQTQTETSAKNRDNNGVGKGSENQGNHGKK